MERKESLHDYKLPEWPDTPTDEAVDNLVELFELTCKSQGEEKEVDPVKKVRDLNLTLFLMNQNMTGNQLIDYHDKIKQIIEEKYPRDEQLNLI